VAAPKAAPANGSNGKVAEAQGSSVPSNPSKFEVKAQVKAGAFTPGTAVGGSDFKPSVEDPSGTKGTAQRKYVVGQVSVEHPGSAPNFPM
jgi:hypothetical protein